MEAEGVTDEVDDDPVNLFQYKGGDTHAAVVHGEVSRGEPVLDDGDQGAEEEDLGCVVVNEKTPDHDGCVIGQQVQVNLQAV